jgi:hypothetical protein
MGGLGGQNTEPPSNPPEGYPFDPEDLFQGAPTRTERARSAFRAVAGPDQSVASEPLEVAPEFDLSRTLAPFGLAPSEAFPGIRFHRVVGDPGRVILVSRSTSKQIGPPWGIGAGSGTGPGAESQ